MKPRYILIPWKDDSIYICLWLFYSEFSDHLEWIAVKKSDVLLFDGTKYGGESIESITKNHDLHKLNDDDDESGH